MIEDAELRDLFQSESKERLDHLEQGLQRLDTDPSDAEAIEEIFRDAHTLKGNARMLSIQSIEKISHQMEELLSQVRKRKSTISRRLISTLYSSIDAIRKLVDEQTTGAPSNVDIEAIVAEFISGIEEISKIASLPSLPAELPEKERDKQPEKKAEDISEEKAPPSPFPSPKPAVAPEEQESIKDKELIAAKILQRVSSHTLYTPTVRIHMHQLSELMTQVGNLTVAKNKIFGLFEGLEKILSSFERITTAAIRSPFELNLIDSSLDANHRSEVNALLKSLHEELHALRDSAYEDVYYLGNVANELVDRIRKLGLVHMSNLFDLFPRMVSELAAACEKEVDFIIEGGEIHVDKRIIEEMKDPIMHMLRNAISHGIEPPEERQQLSKNRKGKIWLKAYQTSSTITIEVSDDGRGIDIGKIKKTALEKQLFSQTELDAMRPTEIYNIIFMPGFSTATEITEISGRGIGMDVVQAHIEKLKGTILLESRPGIGTQILIELPISLVTTDVLLVEVCKNIYALPLDAIETCELVSSQQVFRIEGWDMININDTPVSLAFLGDLLGIEGLSDRDRIDVNNFLCIVLKIGTKRCAVLVDAFLEKQQVVIVPPGYLLNHISLLAGATILKTGKVCVLLNPYQIIKEFEKDHLQTQTTFNVYQASNDTEVVRKSILFVDDSHTMRIVFKRALEEEGYDVTVAENGLEALEKLKSQHVDGVVSDVEMPIMDGLSLVKKLRQQPAFYDTPIILMTSLATEEDKKRAFEAGINAYIVKSEYSQKKLFEKLKELLF